jgi:pyridinium-3,5-bisthiocarboxylic acid mononucleotide nickel chelatase
MRIAYLDCFSGVSGDMLLGAMVDAGVPADLLHSTVAALDVGARVDVLRVNRSGINAAKVDVFCNGEKELPREQFWAQQDVAGTPARGHGHGHGHDRGDHHGRGLKQIREIISHAKLTPATQTTAIAIFEALGAAEAKIHGIPIDQVHFHEVGAVDAMVDIVCAAAGAEHLQVAEWICSPLNVGSGTVQCAHGTFPVPAPATLQLLQGAPVYSAGPQLELVTPTGAAIVARLASRFGGFPRMQVVRSGYGAGSRDTSDLPNVVRLTLGESGPETALGEEVIAVVEASLDDLSPQVFGYVLERALAEGALEAFGTPVQMKKSRPGMLLTVLARPADAGRLARLIFAETTTLGVRVREERRQALDRRWVGVQTRWGEVRVKVASLNGTIGNFAPEYEDCRRIAGEHRVPLKTVMQEAIQAYLRQSDQNA